MQEYLYCLLHRFYAVVCTDKKFQKELVFQFQFTARYALNDIFNSTIMLILLKLDLSFAPLGGHM
jgi:hypothetical protein